MSRLTERLPSAVLLVVACALWGGATVMNKALLVAIPPVSLLVIQLVPSAVVLWVAVLLSGLRLPKASLLVPLVMLGLLNPGISYTLSLMGLARISASVSTLLWAVEPLMVLAIAAVVLRERMTWALLSVIVVGVLGVALVANLREGVASADNDLAGILLLLSAFSAVRSTPCLPESWPTALILCPRSPPAGGPARAGPFSFSLVIRDRLYGRSRRNAAPDDRDGNSLRTPILRDGLLALHYRATLGPGCGCGELLQRHSGLWRRARLSLPRRNAVHDSMGRRRGYPPFRHRARSADTRGGSGVGRALKVGEEGPCSISDARVRAFASRSSVTGRARGL